MKKGRQPLLYTLSSVASWVVDTSLFFLLHLLFSTALGSAAEMICNISARAVSSFFNFSVNNRIVFENRGSFGKAMLRYYCLAVPQLAASTLLLSMFVYLLKPGNSAGTTAIKIIIDGLLFVASFFIQKYWVFQKKDDSTGADRAEDS